MAKIGRNAFTLIMRELPDSVSAYRRTPTFDQDSVPPGLLKAHSTRPGTWGRIVVVRGELLYRIIEPELEEVLLSARTFGVVEPGALHEVAPIGEVEFYVEFLR
jgi:tellurite resistance-related uncharacterized protein